MKRLRFIFSVSQKESRGFWIVLVLMVTSVVAPLLYSHFSYEPLIENEEDLRRVEVELAKLNALEKKSVHEVVQKLFKFDPNTASKKELIALGFYESLADRLINYRNAGGVFYSKKDLKKIYGLKDKMFERIEPYIAIPAFEERDYTEIRKEEPHTFHLNTHRTFEEVIDEAESVDINLADTTALKKLKGIGSVYSKRIVKYQEMLGGYVNIDQLMEVYGFKEETFEKIKTEVFIDSTFLPKKINISTATFKEILAHPYISYEQTKAIVNYRDKQGGFNLLKDLVSESILSEEEFTKVKPYLIF